MAKASREEIADFRSEYLKCTDSRVREFMEVDDQDKDSVKKKTLVLKKLNGGIAPANIPDYYDVLDKYPEDGENWDL